MNKERERLTEIYVQSVCLKDITIGWTFRDCNNIYIYIYIYIYIILRGNIWEMIAMKIESVDA